MATFTQALPSLPCRCYSNRHKQAPNRKPTCPAVTLSFCATKAVTVTEKKKKKFTSKITDTQMKINPHFFLKIKREMQPSRGWIEARGLVLSKKRLLKCMKAETFPPLGHAEVHKTFPLEIFLMQTCLLRPCGQEIPCVHNHELLLHQQHQSVSRPCCWTWSFMLAHKTNTKTSSLHTTKTAQEKQVEFVFS